MRKQLISLCVALCLCIGVVAEVSAQCPGAGDCFTPGGNGTPGCQDTTCCNTVCAADPFCCDTEWDGTCAGEAAGLCGGASQCGPGNGDCFDPAGNGTPGCDDAECCSTVCAEDPFCCDVMWDDVCAGEALDLCGADVIQACCFLDGSCQDVTGLNCDNLGGARQGPGTTCETVNCPVICGPGAGDCFAEGGNGTIGCEDGECCATVCAADSFCCDATWDDICADEALDLCVGAPCVACPGDVNRDSNRDGLDVQGMANCLLDPANGPGFPTSAGCGCADADGDLDVDADDLPAFVTALLDTTGSCPVCGPGNGLCFDLNGNGTPGCEDAGCCETTCLADPLCCDSEWDGLCAAQANVACNPGTITEACCFDVDACFDLVAADCSFLGGTPQGFDSTCATTTCPPSGCGALGSGSCISVPDGNPVSTGSAGCEDAACCTLVCTADPFCCDFAYDQFCQAEGRAICNGDPTTGCTTIVGCIDITVADCAALGGTDTGLPCP